MDNVGTHVTHCCINHGCKYGAGDCPVKTGAVEQEFLCEDCTWPLEEAEIYEASMAATTLTVGYAREDGTITDLPPTSVVDDAIRAALVGLEVAPDWIIRIVAD